LIIMDLLLRETRYDKTKLSVPEKLATRRQTDRMYDPLSIEVRKVRDCRATTATHKVTYSETQLFIRAGKLEAAWKSGDETTHGPVRAPCIIS